MADESNDNIPISANEFRGPDAHGQAAMLLVESLIHGLIEGKVLSVDKAIEIVDVAAEVKTEIAAELGDSPATLRASLTLLRAISRSLEHDRKSD